MAVMAESLRGRTLPYLRAWRQARLYGQAELSRLSGVSPSTLARAERGDAVVSFANIRKIAEALDIRPEELLAGEPAETPAPRQAGKADKPRKTHRR